MAERGLVWSDSLHHSHFVDIALTAKGLDAISRAEPLYTKPIRELFIAAIGRERLGTFADACEDVAAAVTNELDDAVSADDELSRAEVECDRI